MNEEFHNVQLVRVGKDSYLYKCIKCGVTDDFKDTPCNQQKNAEERIEE